MGAWRRYQDIKIVNNAQLLRNWNPAGRSIMPEWFINKIPVCTLLLINMYVTSVPTYSMSAAISSTFTKSRRWLPSGARVHNPIRTLRLHRSVHCATTWLNCGIRGTCSNNFFRNAARMTGFSVRT